MGDTQTVEAAEACLATLAPECPSCGWEVTGTACPTQHDLAPPKADQQVGHVVTYRRGLRRRFGVVVAVTDGLFETVEPGSTRIRSVRAARTDRSDAYDGLEGIPSPRYRLVALSREDAWSDGLGAWLASNPTAHLDTIGDRRLFGRSALSCSDLDGLQRADLAPSEADWLTMHVHRHNGAWGSAFSAALTLDANAYPDHLLVLIEAASHHPSLIDQQDFIDHVGLIEDEGLGVALLRMLAGTGSSDDASAAVEELVALGGPGLGTKVSGTIDGSRTVPDNGWSRAATGCAVSVADLAMIDSEWPSIADDLIDRQLVLRSSEGVTDLPLHLQGRIAIETLLDDELNSIGAYEELARRAYAARDANRLKSIESARTADLVALDQLRRGEVPESIPEHPVAQAVAASIRAGMAHPNALRDASAWPVLSDMITDEVAGRYPDQAAVWHLRKAIADLFDGDPDAAYARAKRALGQTHDEVVRDEALNVIAFVLNAQGRSEEAIAALEKALEGEYSANLQANIGIIAEELRPEVAAEHVTRLAREAPTLDLKLAAVRHAFGIWATGIAAWDDEALSMPIELVETFRELLVGDIPYDDYVSLIQLLAQADRDWLANFGNSDRGPHRLSPAWKIYVARAGRDPSSFVDALVDVSKSGIDDEWFEAEVDTFVSSLRSMIFEDIGAIGPASYAFAAIDAGLELDDFDYVTLSCGAAMSILAVIHEDDGLPSDAVVAMIGTARERLRRLDPDQREQVEPLVAMTGDRYGGVVGSFHAQMHDEIIDALRTIGSQLYGTPHRRIRWEIVEQAVRPMREQALRSASDIRAAVPFVSDREMQSSLRELERAFAELASKLSSPRRLF